MHASTIFLGLVAIGAALAQPHSVSCSTSAIIQPTSTSTSDANAQLPQHIVSTSSTIKYFQRLLVQGGSLLTGEALRKLIVFDFKGAQPVSGALGGATKVAVSTISGLI